MLTFIAMYKKHSSCEPANDDAELFGPCGRSPIYPLAQSSAAVQTEDQDLRTKRKALEFTKKLCKDVPNLRPALAITLQESPWLTRSLQHTDQLIQCSAVGLLRELVDDQQTLATLQADAELIRAFTGVRDQMCGLPEVDKSAVLEEIAMADEIAEHLGIACDT